MGRYNPQKMDRNEASEELLRVGELPFEQRAAALARMAEELETRLMHLSAEDSVAVEEEREGN